MSNPLRLKTFPGALYNGDGTLLVGNGPDFDSAMIDALPYKALIRDTPGDVEVAVLEEGDRLWSAWCTKGLLMLLCRVA